MEKGTAIELKEVGKRYGLRPVLSCLNILVQKGESVALFGNNGSGKTTLLRMIATLLAPSAGSLKVLGYDAERQRQEIRKKIRFLGHEKNIYDKLSPLENMRLFAGVRGLSTKESALFELLDRFRLGKHCHREVRDLSEGMKKRLVLARLLLGESELILLDEPHPTLDTDGRELLSELIREWQGAGKTIVLASHDHEQTLEHVDRLIVLHDGTLRYDGAPRPLKEVFEEGP